MANVENRSPSSHRVAAIEGTWGVRYQVKDVSRSVQFSCNRFDDFILRNRQRLRRVPDDIGNHNSVMSNAIIAAKEHHSQFIIVGVFVGQYHRISRLDC